MAALSANQRQEVLVRFSRRLSDRREPFSLTRPALVAAIAAVDDWIEANAVSFNQALPPVARTGLTAAQKTELLFIVAEQRFG